MSTKILQSFASCLAAVGLALSGVSAVGADTLLRVWGLETGEHSIGIEAAVREFERRNPGVEVQMAVIPVSSVQGVMDNQKLICSVAGGNPPDVVFQDRFQVGEWAATGALSSLETYLREDRAPRPEDYYEPCWNECVYEGAVYGIPDDADVRVLYYNEAILREEGFVDPETGQVLLPRDWDALVEMAAQLNVRAGDRYSRVGFIPNFGNAWLYLYSFLNGGSFLSPDGETCTLAAPENVEALRWMADAYEALGGYSALKGFQDGFGSRVTDPFLVGNVVFKIDVDNFVRDIARYRPDMEFGIASPPPPPGRESCTWSGGFAWVIPEGAANHDVAVDFLHWMTSTPGRELRAEAQWRSNRSRGRSFFPRLPAKRDAAEIVLDRFSPEEPRMREVSFERLDILENTRTRPVTPVGALLWDQHNEAFFAAVTGSAEPRAALEGAQAVVQRQLDIVHRDESARPPLVRWSIPVAIFAGLGVLLLLVYAVSLRRLPGNGARRRRELWVGLAFASPWLIGFSALTLWPMLQSIVLSLSEYDVLNPARWVGLENYRRAFAEDHLFWKSLWNTVYMALWVPVTLAVGLAIALLLNTEVKGMSVWRTLFYLPAVIPTVAASILWVWLLNPSAGLLNQALGLVGIPGPDWLQDEAWAKPGIVLTVLWAAGGSMIIWLAGLAGIPRSYYDAAAVDGANAWQRFWNVTIPQLTPYIFFNLIMGIIATFQIFNQAYIMTEGGPNNATRFFVLRLFDVAFRYFEMGYASAMAWVLFVIVLALTLVNFVLAPRWVHYEGGTR